MNALASLFGGLLGGGAAKAEAPKAANDNRAPVAKAENPAPEAVVKQLATPEARRAALKLLSTAVEKDDAAAKAAKEAPKAEAAGDDAMTKMLMQALMGGEEAPAAAKEASKAEAKEEPEMSGEDLAGMMQMLQVLGGRGDRQAPVPKAA